MTDLLKKSFFIFVFLLAVLVLKPSFAKAEIVIQPDFKGTIVITFPNGEVNVVESGDPLPKIPSQSVLEVVDGQISVTTGQGDAVELACLGSATSAGDGSAATLACGGDSGLITAVKGTLHFTDPSGVKLDLAEGTQHPIKPAKEKVAPATAAGEPVGTPLESNEPPVDSRNIESSPQ